MGFSCCSGNFSSRSLGGYLHYPSSFYPSNLVCCTDLCSPSPCQLGSSLYSSCQETCCEPTNCLTSCVVSSPCQMSCSHPRTSTLCSPCWMTYAGPRGFRPQGYGVRGFPTLSYGSTFCHPTYFGFRHLQPFCYKPIYGSGFYRLTC
ncbi:keratin-associated protein 13-1-like [Prionailurus bengalensis]|uniref:keratin-associated protein 13-1-like n=1 Tax=Prionailurus bengalensis TaxID=37029 RepID=UPI001CAA24DB|nr:keratin-associated protein 13-1-like [Prionailurus bengalensis]